MKLNKTQAALAMALAIASTGAMSAPDRDQEKLRAIEAELKTTFSNYAITGFQPSPIEGIFEIHAGGQVHYYEPNGKLLIFGQIYNSDGVNLTEQSKVAAIKSAVDDADLSSAIKIQDGQIPIIEISNPDCGYCAEYERWITNISKEYSIERSVIFTSQSMFKNSIGKMNSVICSSDRAKAYEEMVSGKFNDQECAESKNVLEDHDRITKSLGVTGTPTFILPSGKVIIGLKKDLLEAYFIESKVKL